DIALEGVDRVVHLAAAVGVGQSMYEIADYVRKNTHATAVFLERLVARPTRPTRLVVASSMSIYGEGEYVCPLHGHLAPSPRPADERARRRGRAGGRPRRLDRPRGERPLPGRRHPPLLRRHATCRRAARLPYARVARARHGRAHLVARRPGGGRPRRRGDRGA